MAKRVRLTRAFFDRSVHAVAPKLIGATLLVDGVGGTIVEVEAYDHEDPAAHGYRGRTARNAVMFGPAGHAYVYLIYGLYWCLNFVCEPEGVANAVLIRALEPLEGIELMSRHRRTERLTDLARGPGRLAAAFRIDHRLDGLDLCAPGTIWLGTAIRRRGKIGESCRIGITRDAHLVLRFYESGNPFVSGPARLRA